MQWLNAASNFYMVNQANLSIISLGAAIEAGFRSCCLIMAIKCVPVAWGGDFFY